MRRSIIGVVVTLALLSTVVAVMGQTPDPLLGTWRVNVAKSTYSPGPPPKSNGSVWESLGGGQFKSTADAVDAKGQSTRTEVIFRFDGAEVPVKGAAVPTTRVYKRIDARSYEFVTKINGKVTTTLRSVMAPDGKTRTNTSTGTNAQGQTVKDVVLWEKQ